jgi:hypothetical protein
MNTKVQSAGRAASVLAMTMVVICVALLMIGWGVRTVRHADQIKARGVRTTGTVTVDDTGGDGPSCTVSFVTASGSHEGGTVDCLAAGSAASVQVVYDPSAVNVFRLAGQSGGARSGWEWVIGGGILLAFALLGSMVGLLLFLSRKRIAGALSWAQWQPPKPGSSV